jgi:toxin ParE1/3/4
MKLILTPQATRDLEAIGDWSAIDSPFRAVTFTDELLSHLQVIRATPNAFPLVEKYASRGVRRYAWRDYLAFYRVRGDVVSVFHITHGARNTSERSLDD